MSKFGKWHYDGGKLIRDDDGRVIADILPSLDDFKDLWEIARHARLIAAAPELCEMLEEELIPTSDYGGIISFERERKVRELLNRIDGINQA